MVIKKAGLNFSIDPGIKSVACVKSLVLLLYLITDREDSSELTK